MKNFVVIPGFVKSINDGDEHYISSSKLIQLFGVHPEQCYVMTVEDYLRKRHMDHLKNLVVLTPQENGNYNLDEIGVGK